ncbi:response regulator [Trichormus sp. NMC-1]|uniref:response regulator n=1 Tax=Trichormus sp. NMC-1 TaxID=1853259 RepID=UPI0008DC0CB5
MNTILIIEDEPQIRKNIQQILDLEGFATITAEDGLEGLDMAEKHQPDMIICDVMMPNLDGYGLIEVLRQKPLTADIPFIFLTAKAENNDLRQGMELGADDYLIKPFKADELIRAISTRFEKRQVLTL